MKRKILIFFITLCLAISPISFVFAADEVVDENAMQTEEIKDEVKEEVKEEGQKQELQTEKTKTEEIKKTQQEENVEKKVVETKVEEPKTEVEIEESKAEAKTEVKVEPKMALTSTPKNTTKDEYTIHFENIVHAQKITKEEDGSVTLGTSELTNTPQTKTMSARGVLNEVGGKDYKTGLYGVDYQFLNVYAAVKVDVDENNQVITVHHTNEPTCIESEDTLDLTTVNKIQYKGNGEIILTLIDPKTQTTTTQTLKNTKNVYITPIYKRTYNWFLDYQYIDNISTGSGSWSNKDAVTSYKHIFSNPEEKSPELTKGEYQFAYWQEEGKITPYFAGDSYEYNGVEQPKGSTKTIITYAYWQPAVKVNLYNGSELINTISSFDSVNSTSFDKLADTDIQQFLGWFDENDQLADTYQAPAITKENNSVLIINLFAKFKEIIQPEPEPEPEPVVEPEKPNEPTVTPTQPTKPITDNTISAGDEEPVRQVRAAAPINTNTITINPPTTPTTKPAVEKITIKNNKAPKAEPQGAWALINLIATILGCIIALIAICLQKKSDNEEYTEDEKSDIRKMRFTKIASFLIGIISIIIFVLTEDMSLPMILVDKWTILMIILFIIEIVYFYIIKIYSDEDEEEIEE